MFPCRGPASREGRIADEATSWRYGDVVSPHKRALKRRGDTKKGEQAGYRRTRGRTEGIRDEHLEVLADHSTDGWDQIPTGKVGNRCPRDPR